MSARIRASRYHNQINVLFPFRWRKTSTIACKQCPAVFCVAHTPPLFHFMPSLFRGIMSEASGYTFSTQINVIETAVSLIQPNAAPHLLSGPCRLIARFSWEANYLLWSFPPALHLRFHNALITITSIVFYVNANILMI